jgi:hypothetical protein
MVMGSSLIHKESFSIKAFGTTENKQIEIWWLAERAKIWCLTIGVLKILKIKKNIIISKRTQIYLTKIQVISSRETVLTTITIEAVKMQRFLLIKEIYSNMQLHLTLVNLI